MGGPPPHGDRCPFSRRCLHLPLLPLFLCLLLVQDVSAVRWGANGVTAPTGIRRRFTICDQHVFLFGGVSSEGLMSDTVLYDLRTRRWIELSVTGDAPPAQDSAHLHCVNNTVFQLGSSSLGPGYPPELRVLHLDTLEWVKVPIAGLDAEHKYGADTARMGIGLRLSHYRGWRVSDNGDFPHRPYHLLVHKPYHAVQEVVQGTASFGEAWSLSLSQNKSAKIEIGEEIHGEALLSSEDRISLHLPGTRLGLVAGDDGFPWSQLEYATLYHMDHLYFCRLPITGMAPGERGFGAAAAIVRIPVHVVREFRDSGGHRLYESGALNEDESESVPPGNRSATVVDWRVVLVVMQGCGPGTDTPTDCKEPRSVGNNSVLVLDLTPLYRELSLPARLGLDPRLASPSGVPEAHGYDKSGRVSSGPMLSNDAGEMRFFDNVDKENHSGFFSYCAVPDLRWHRVFGLGNHVKWQASGLIVHAAGRESASAVWADEGEFQRGERTLSTDEPFYAYPDTGAMNTSQSSGAGCSSTHFRDQPLPLRYPILTAGKDSRLTLLTCFPVGRSGKLGWLGATSVLVQGGTQNVAAFFHAVNILEVIGLVQSDRAEEAGVWEDGVGKIKSQFHGQVLSDEASARLDTRVMFWGLWSEMGDQQGLSLEGRSHQPTASIPIRGRLKLTVDHAIPGMPLRSQEDASSSSPIMSRSSGLAASSGHDLHFLTEKEEKWLDLGMAQLEALQSCGCWGSESAGLDLAFSTPAGFARWPEEAERILRRIDKELETESVMFVGGGCPPQPRSLFTDILCEPRSVFTTLQTIPLPSGDGVFHPATLQWWPSHIHTIPQLPQSRSYRLVVVPSGLIAVSGPLLDMRSVLEYFTRQPRKMWYLSFHDTSPWTTVAIDDRIPLIPELSGPTLFNVVAAPCSKDSNTTVGSDVSCFYMLGGSWFNFQKLRDSLGQDNDDEDFQHAAVARELVIEARVRESPALSVTLIAWTPSYDHEEDAIMCLTALHPSLAAANGRIFMIGGGIYVRDADLSLNGGLSPQVCVLDIEEKQLQVYPDKLPKSVLQGVAVILGRFIIVAFGYTTDLSVMVVAIDWETLELFQINPTTFPSDVVTSGSVPFHQLPPDSTLEETNLRSTALPDMKQSAKQQPTSLINPSCALYGTRLACWGGFASAMGAPITGVSVFWAGIHHLQVSQKVGEMEEGGSLSPYSQQRLNADCVLNERSPCGDLQTALRRVSRETSPSFHRLDEVKILVQISSQVTTHPVAVEVPVVIEGDRDLPLIPTLLCLRREETDAALLAPFHPHKVFGLEGEPCLTISHQPSSTSEVRRLKIEAGGSLSYPRPALRVNGSRVQVENTEIRGFGGFQTVGSESGVMGLRGGCIGAAYATVELSNVALSGCSAMEGGGAFFFGSTVKAEGFVVVNNLGRLQGGGVCITGGEVALRHSSLLQNMLYPGGKGDDGSTVFGGEDAVSVARQAAKGAGLYCFGSLQLLLEDTTIAENTVWTQREPELETGGGAAVLFSQLRIVRSNFLRNRGGEGAALFLSRSSGEIQGSNFSENVANVRGGAVLMERCGAVKLLGSLVRDNQAGVCAYYCDEEGAGAGGSDQGIGGGGVWIDSPFQAAQFEEVEVSHNVAKRGNGGGVVVTGNRKGVALSEAIEFTGSVRVRGNHAERGGGGGLFYTSLSADSLHHIVVENQARFGPNAATEARRLRLIVEEEAVIGSGQRLEADWIRVEALDEYGEEMLGLNGTSARLQVASPDGQSRPFVSVGGVEEVEEGKATLKGLEIVAKPGSVISLRAEASSSWGVLSSQEVNVTVSDCPPGQQAVDQRCDVCSLGFYFSIEDGGTLCLPCPAGTMLDPVSRSSCLLCSPGFFSLGNATECSPCAKNTFSGLGWRTCLRCPPGAGWQCEGGILHPPPSGFYLDVTTTTGTSRRSSRQVPVVAAALDHVLFSMPQVTAYGKSVVEEAEDVCDRRASFLVELESSLLHATPWMNETLTLHSNSYSVDVNGLDHDSRLVPCPLAGGCRSSCSGDVVHCEEGYTGLACVSCAAGYGLAEGACKPCASPDVALVVFNLLLMMALVALLCCISAHAPQSSLLIVSLKQLFHLSVIYGILTMLKLPPPDSLGDVLSSGLWFGGFNLGHKSWRCSVDSNILTASYLDILSPPLLLLGTFGLLVSYRCCARRRKRRRSRLNVATGASAKEDRQQPLPTSSSTKESSSPPKAPMVSSPFVMGPWGEGKESREKERVEEEGAAESSLSRPPPRRSLGFVTIILFQLFLPRILRSAAALLYRHPSTIGDPRPQKPEGKAEEERGRAGAEQISLNRLDPSVVMGDNDHVTSVILAGFACLVGLGVFIALILVLKRSEKARRRDSMLFPLVAGFDASGSRWWSELILLLRHVLLLVIILWTTDPVLESYLVINALALFLALHFASQNYNLLLHKLVDRLYSLGAIGVSFLGVAQADGTWWRPLITFISWVLLVLPLAILIYVLVLDGVWSAIALCCSRGVEYGSKHRQSHILLRLLQPWQWTATSCSFCFCRKTKSKKRLKSSAMSGSHDPTSPASAETHQTLSRVRAGIAEGGGSCTKAASVSSMSESSDLKADSALIFSSTPWSPGKRLPS